MKKLTILFLCLCTGSLSFAQSKEIIKNYIDRYKDLAIEEMIRTGVPASITLAQGIHETGAGTSKLVRSSNNHFGIKCKSEWKGEWVSHDDDARGECFRKYSNPEDSYRDHSDFLKNRPYYKALFTLDPLDYEGWAYGLKKAGYATNPKYPQILIKLIEDYNLQDYTYIALRQKKNPNSAEWTKSTTVTTTKDEEVDEKKEVVKSEPLVSAPVKNKLLENSASAVKKSTTKQYPSGIFYINETKVVFAEKGTSFLKLAQEHNISLPKLFEYNEMQPQDIAAKDQLVFLQRKKKNGANEYHIVVDGETIADIAQAEGIRKENLLEYNHLTEAMQPAPGEKLYLGSKSPALPKLLRLK